MEDKWFDGELLDLARRQHGVVTRAQLLERGIRDDQIRYRVRRGRFLVVGRGVYVVRGFESTFRQRVMIGALSLGDGAFASHRCAALLRNLDGVSLAPLEFTVGRRRVSAPKQPTLHRVSSVDERDWAVVDAIPTATTTRIVVDLSLDQSVSFGVVERVFECGQRRRDTSHAAIRAMVERRGRSGVRNIGRARAFAALLVDDGVVNHSELETLFFQLMRDSGLPLPTRQRVVLRHDGRLAFADYGYDGVDGLIELLGFRWHSSSAALSSDAERNNELQLANKTVLQFTWDQVVNRPRQVVEQVAELLGRRTRQGDTQDAQELGDG